MASRTKLTNSSDEADIASLISGDSIFAIPYFQRPYKWKPPRLRRLEGDVLEIVDGRSENHFMGALIMHGRRSNPSQPTVYDLIDGQQRVTTIFLYICAAIRVLCKHGLHDEAASLFQKYICLGRATALISNVRLHSCGEDRGQMNAVMADLTSDQKFAEKLGDQYRPLPLPHNGKSSGTLVSNYRSAVKFLGVHLDQGGEERLRAIYSAFLEALSVVQIDVSNPTNGPKIFDSLNSQQEPMTIGDLVRNDIFSRVAGSEVAEIERVDRDTWQPFYNSFQVGDRNYFEEYFFPFGLVHNQNVTKAASYSYLRQRWQGFSSPAEIVSDLSAYKNAFLDLVTGGNSQGHPQDLHAALKDLWRSGAPSSTYPFLMRVSQAAEERQVSIEAAVSVLRLVEAFLVRRAIVGIEPTGLHSIFKRLWQDVSSEFTREKLSETLRSRATLIWPSNMDVQAAVRNRPIYGAAIANYILLEYDRSLNGDHPSNVPWIEHVLPQTMSPTWRTLFTDAEHRKRVNLLANLLPLSSEMNIELSNSAYAIKRSAYESDSMFASTRSFARSEPEWTAESMDRRSEVLAVWALERWPE